MQRIIDTHIHIWDFSRADYPWLKGDTSILNRTYSISEIEEERKIAFIVEVWIQGIILEDHGNFAVFWLHIIDLLAININIAAADGL